MPNSKAKGSSFESFIAKEIALAFSSLDITEDDCYRTKNSGATKKQPGDLQFSPALAKLFPVLIECKHYRNVHIQLGKSIDCQPKSFAIRSWWEQLIQEEKNYKKTFKKHKHGLLIFRQNNCPVLVALYREAQTSLVAKEAHYNWQLETSWKKKPILILPFKQFLAHYVKQKEKSK